MTDAARKLLENRLALPEEERVDIATEIIASLDGPPDADWDVTWLAELDRRAKAAAQRGDTSADWSDVRSRILGDIGAT
jgi:hypothetical protein